MGRSEKGGKVMATKKTKDSKVKVGKLKVQTTKVKPKDLKKVKGGSSSTS